MFSFLCLLFLAAGPLVNTVPTGGGGDGGGPGMGRCECERPPGGGAGGVRDGGDASDRAGSWTKLLCPPPPDDEPGWCPSRLSRSPSSSLPAARRREQSSLSY